MQGEIFLKYYYPGHIQNCQDCRQNVAQLTSENEIEYLITVIDNRKLLNGWNAYQPFFGEIASVMASAGCSNWSNSDDISNLFGIAYGNSFLQIEKLSLSFSEEQKKLCQTIADHAYPIIK